MLVVVASHNVVVIHDYFTKTAVCRTIQQLPHVKVHELCLVGFFFARAVRSVNMTDGFLDGNCGSTSFYSTRYYGSESPSYRFPWGGGSYL